MADITSFITLEESLARTARRAYRREVQPVADRIVALAIEDGRDDEASALLGGVCLSAACLGLRRRSETHFLQAMLLGASMLHRGNVRRTAMYRRGAIPNPVALAADQFENVLKASTITLQRRARDVIHWVSAADEPPTQTVQPDPFISFHELPSRVLVHKAADKDLAALVNASVMGTGEQLIDVAANLTTSRLVALGMLDEAEELGVVEYVISAVLDDRTCPVCSALDGTTFTVERAIDRLSRELLMDGDDLRANSPFPGQSKEAVANLEAMDEDELVARGFDTPPYHPSCRCVLLPVEEEVQKAFDPNQPRDERGRWTDGLAHADEKALLTAFRAEVRKQKHYRFREDLDDDQKKVIDYYGGGGYKRMNRMLRKQAQESPILPESQIGRSIERLDSVFARSDSVLPESVALYRGVRSLSSDPNVGDAFVDPGFQSWSYDRDTAYTFSEGRGAIFRMKAEKGDPGLIIAGVESEIVLPRGTAYHVVAVDERMQVYFPPKGVAPTDSHFARVITLERMREEVQKAGFDPNQPRDEGGKWTDTGGGFPTIDPKTIFEDDAVAFLKSDSARRYENRFMLEPELKVLNEWQWGKAEDGSGSRAINRMLRGQDPENDLERASRVEKFPEQVRELDAIIAGSRMKQDVTVYRGLRDFREPVVGDEIGDPGYQSWTLSRETATLPYFSAEGDVVLRRKLSEGDSALWMSKEEHEFVLPRGLKHRVVSVERDAEVMSGYDYNKDKPIMLRRTLVTVEAIRES